MYLPSTKPSWPWPITFGRNLLNLLPITPDMILYNVIGRQFFKDFLSFNPFGRSVMIPILWLSDRIPISSEKVIYYIMNQIKSESLIELTTEPWDPWCNSMSAMLYCMENFVTAYWLAWIFVKCRRTLLFGNVFKMCVAWCSHKALKVSLWWVCRPLTIENLNSWQSLLSVN